MSHGRLYKHMSKNPTKRKRIRLKPELVPRTLWGRSVYQKLRSQGRRRVWECIRADVLKRAKGKCQICGHYQKKGMICHEKWKYDKKALNASLTGFKIVCPMCNNVLHFGRTMAVLWEKNPQILEDVLLHVSEVNQVNRDQASKILDDGMWAWVEIADEEWKINIDPKLVSRYPDLKNLEL